MTEEQKQKCREAFELELIDNHMYTPQDLRQEGGYYVDDELQFAWELASASWEKAVQMQRAPLTAKQINELEAEAGLDQYELVRLVERAHGITGEAA